MLNEKLIKIYRDLEYSKRQEMLRIICELTLVEKPTYWGWMQGNSIPYRKRVIISQFMNIEEKDLFPEYETDMQKRKQFC